MSTQPIHRTAERETETRSQAIARRLRGQMGERNLKQAAIAKAIQRSQPVVSDRLNGKMAFEIDELDMIQRATGISADYLWTGNLPATQKSAGPLEETGTHESFLSESNRRPFHYEGNGQVVIPFPARPEPPAAEHSESAVVIPFPSPSKGQAA